MTLSPEFRAIHARQEAEAERARAAPAPDPRRYFAGLDLGQAQDHSALAVVERTAPPDPERAGKTVGII